MSSEESQTATEIRAAEKGKGGMAYEVILSEPQIEAVPKRPVSPPKVSTSIEEIANKLKAAEERRQSLEAQRLSQLADKWNKIEEASQKKAEFNSTFITQTKEQLEKKMEVITENRETLMNSLRSKLKDHDDRVHEVRKSLEVQKEEIKENLEKKLAVASDNRDEKIQKMVEKLKEHEEKVQNVKRTNEAKIQQLEERIQSKLEIASEKREAVIQRKLENLKEHDRHVEEVRHNKMNSGEMLASG